MNLRLFLYNIVPIKDKLLVLGAFNIHVCCSSHHLVKEFVDSFDLVQHDNGPTHEHTLDLLAFHCLTLKAVCLIICLSCFMQYFHICLRVIGRTCIILM